MKTNSNLNYCILLTPKQIKFLSDPLQGTSRCATLLSMIAMANIEDEHTDDGTSVRVGQLSAQITKLADQWSVNPKTARKLIQHFNDQNLISTSSGPFGSIHTMLCLSGWIQDGMTIRNPFYQRPSTTLNPILDDTPSVADHMDSHDDSSARFPEDCPSLEGHPPFSMEAITLADPIPGELFRPDSAPLDDETQSQTLGQTNASSMNS